MSPPEDVDDQETKTDLTWEVTIGSDGFVRLSPEFVGPFLAARLAWEQGQVAAAPRGTTKKRERHETTRPTGQPIWLGIPRAAELLDEEPESLRKKLERAARRGPDEQIESDINGLRGRKLGRLWKVLIPPGWAPKGGR